MKIWTCGSSPWSGSGNAWTWIKNVNDASILRNFWNYFGAIQMISCRDWWPWTKPGYIAKIWRQSNNQWRGGIAAHPAPKIPSAVIRWKISRLDSVFWDQGDILLVDYLPKGHTTNAEYYSLHFEVKTPLKVHKRSLVLARQCHGSPGTCNPEETGLPGLPVPWSPTLFSVSGPVGLPSVRWTEKQLKGRHFSSDAEVIAAAETWLDRQRSDFFEWLSRVRATG